MRTLLLLLPLLALGSCSTYYEHRFAPAPIDLDLSLGEQSDARARGLVTVRGIRRPADGRGAVVEALLRIENLGPTPVELVTETLSLVSADLRELGRPAVRPDPAPLGQGVSENYELEFELAPEASPRDYDLQGLNLKFEVDFGGQRVMHGITFDRSYQPHTNEPRVSFGFGFFHGS